MHASTFSHSQHSSRLTTNQWMRGCAYVSSIPFAFTLGNPATVHEGTIKQKQKCAPQEKHEFSLAVTSSMFLLHSPRGFPDLLRNCQNYVRINLSNHPRKSRSPLTQTFGMRTCCQMCCVDQKRRVNTKGCYPGVKNLMYNIALFKSRCQQ